MGSREMRERGTREKKLKRKKESKHPQNVYVGKEKKKRKNNSWKNEHLC